MSLVFDLVLKTLVRQKPKSGFVMIPQTGHQIYQMAYQQACHQITQRKVEKYLQN